MCDAVYPKCVERDISLEQQVEKHVSLLRQSGKGSKELSRLRRRFRFWLTRDHKRAQDVADRIVNMTSPK